MIIPGKIPYIKKANLKLSISAGIMINQSDWIPAHDHAVYFGDKYAAPYDRIMVKIYLDDQILASQSMDQPLHMDYDFLDTDTTVDHFLKIAVSGFEQKFYEQIKDIGDPYPMIAIDTIKLENLNMQQIIQDHGSYVLADTPNTVTIPSTHMGQSGYQSLYFTTPIYVWLLENEANPNYYL